MSVRERESAPTFGEIEYLLSFNTTVRFFPRLPALFSPSSARPPVSAPSPITAITRCFSFFTSFPAAKPRAAEIEVEAWPVPKESY